MSYNLTEDEIDLVKSLKPYPKFYPDYVNELEYLASLKIAAKHPSGWATGSEHHLAMNWLRSLQPSRIKQCKGCGQ